VLKAGNGTGDTIFVFPGTYAENVVVDKDYLSIIGAVFAGYARPDIVPATGYPLVVNAQGFMAKRLRMAGTLFDCAAQHGNGFLYEDCVFDGDGSGGTCGLRLVPAQVGADITHYTASEGVVRGNLFRGCATGLIFDTAAAPVGVGSTDNLIVGNRFYSNTEDIATFDTGVAGTYSVQLADIIGNYFADKNKTVYIDLTTNKAGAAGVQTGTIMDNTFAADAITAGNQVKMVGTGFTFAGNLTTVGVKDGSGLD
jgi:nitrous oxidase accessory protein NosD